MKDSNKTLWYEIKRTLLKKLKDSMWNQNTSSGELEMGKDRKSSDITTPDLWSDIPEPTRRVSSNGLLNYSTSICLRDLRSLKWHPTSSSPKWHPHKGSSSDSLLNDSISICLRDLIIGKRKFNRLLRPNLPAMHIFGSRTDKSGRWTQLLQRLAPAEGEVSSFHLFCQKDAYPFPTSRVQTDKC